MNFRKLFELQNNKPLDIEALEAQALSLHCSSLIPPHHCPPRLPLISFSCLFFLSLTFCHILPLPLFTSSSPSL